MKHSENPSIRGKTEYIETETVIVVKVVEWVWNNPPTFL